MGVVGVWGDTSFCHLGDYVIVNVYNFCVGHKLLPGFIRTAVHCQGLDPPKNGKISPASCMSGGSFGTSCTVTCSQGFTLTGTHVRTCNTKGTWSGLNDTTCDGEEGFWDTQKALTDVSFWSPVFVLFSNTDTQPPTFGNTCPVTFVRDAGECNLNITVSWSEPNATDNSGKVRMTYPRLRPPVTLGVGRYAISYVAMDYEGYRVYCNFSVHIQGTKNIYLLFFWDLSVSAQRLQLINIISIFIVKR